MENLANALLIGGQKGGTGKSTTALNLSIMSTIMGHDTILIDTDKNQFSSSMCLQHRQELKIYPTPDCVQLTGKIINDLQNISKRYKRVIIDAGGRDSVELRFAMTANCVSKMLSPFKPSEFDLATLEAVDDLVMQAQGINQNLDAYLFFTHCSTHVRDIALDDAKKYSQTFNNIKLCPISLYDRVSYKNHVAAGLSLVEFETKNLEGQPSYRIRPPKASIEMCALYKFVFGEQFIHSFINKFEEKNLQTNIEVG